MKSRHVLLLLPAVLSAAVSGGCKKNTDTEINYLSGTLSLSMPSYVNPGYTKTFLLDDLMTVSRADGGPVGYRFLDPVTGKADTLVTADGTVLKREYTVSVPDTIATLSLTLGAFVAADSGYSGTSASASFTVVKPGWDEGCSITNFVTDPDAVFLDERDGRTYYKTRIGGLDWMRNNLAYEGGQDGEEVLGVSYAQSDAMSEIFGRYYTWEEAKTACPEGWRLPTDAEWTGLCEGAGPGGKLPGVAGKVMADLYFNGAKMWEYWPKVPITDEFRLSVMPVGYATVSGEEYKEYKFEGLYTYAVFWTSDGNDEVGGDGVCRYINHKENTIYRGRRSNTDFAASVRCVKDVKE